MATSGVPTTTIASLAITAPGMTLDLQNEILLTGTGGDVSLGLITLGMIAVCAGDAAINETRR